MDPIYKHKYSDLILSRKEWFELPYYQKNDYWYIIPTGIVTTDHTEIITFPELPPNSQA